MSNPIEEFKRQRMKKFEKSQAPSKSTEERSDATRVQQKKVRVESKAPAAQRPSSPYTKQDKEATEQYSKIGEIRRRNYYLNDPNFPRRINQDAADAQVRKTSFTDQNTLPFWLHAISPSQQIGAIIDGVKGGSYQDYVTSLTYGNSGIFTNKYANSHPIITSIGNGVFDLAVPTGGSSLYRWGTTPQMIGQGASKQVWTTPLSRRVTYIGGDPAYMAEQSTFPRTLKYTYKGMTKDGQAVHTAPKVIMRKNPSKSFVQDMHRRGIFRVRMPGDPEKVWLNKRTGKLGLDIELGWNPQVGTVFVDPEIMTVPEYAAMMGI